MDNSNTLINFWYCVCQVSKKKSESTLGRRMTWHPVYIRISRRFSTPMSYCTLDNTHLLDTVHHLITPHLLVKVIKLLNYWYYRSDSNFTIVPFLCSPGIYTVPVCIYLFTTQPKCNTGSRKMNRVLSAKVQYFGYCANTVKTLEKSEFWEYYQKWHAISKYQYEQEKLIHWWSYMFSLVVYFLCSVQGINY